MTILAIDPSINFCGWAFGHDDEPFESGVIRTRGKTDAEKLYDLRIELLDIIDRARPSRAVVEVPQPFTYARSTNKRTGKTLNLSALMKLSQAVGVTLCTLENGIIVIEILPPAWKGTMNKQLAQGITGKKNHNEADAILMYRYSKARKL